MHPDVLKTEILMYLRRNSKTKMEVSIDEPLNVDWDGNELLLSDILGTDDDVISQRLENEVEIQASGKSNFQAFSKGTDDYQIAVRAWKAGGKGENTERSGGPSGDFTVLYFQAGKTDHEEAEEGNCKV